MVAPLRIVFFGTPQFAVPTLEALLASPHSVVGVFTQPDRPRGRGQKVSDAPVKSTAIRHELPVLQPDRLREQDVESSLRDLAADLGVVAAYGKLIPDRLLAIPRFGMINVHASLLPRYRGAAPVHRAVMAGEAQTGVTIMRVIRELDAGGMFATVTRSIGPDDTSDVVEHDLAAIGGALLVSVADQLSAGTAVEVAQDASQATYAAKITKDDGLIHWGLSAQTIHDQVRGLYPWPHAYTFADAARLIILRTHVGDVAGAPPGTVTAARPEGIHVAAGDGRTVVIDELQPEGRRPMSARDFLAGRPLPVGTILGRR
jgi:methionyl-tRNA formyltransferase